MDASNAIRQVNEIQNVLNLKHGLYSDAITMKTPALYTRLQQLRSTTTGKLEVKKCLSFHIKCALLYPDELPDLILAFEFPLDYPSGSACSVRAIGAKDFTSGDGEHIYEGCVDVKHVTRLWELLLSKCETNKSMS